jgi:hypothetical protein
MWLILHLLTWRNLRWVWCNDSVCYAQVPTHVFLLENYRMHLFKNKISSYIPHRYILEMVDHPIIISVPTQMTNGIQLITQICNKLRILISSKNMRGITDVHKSMVNMHITRQLTYYLPNKDSTQLIETSTM